VGAAVTPAAPGVGVAATVVAATVLGAVVPPAAPGVGAAAAVAAATAVGVGTATAVAAATAVGAVVTPAASGVGAAAAVAGAAKSPAKPPPRLRRDNNPCLPQVCARWEPLQPAHTFGSLLLMWS